MNVLKSIVIFALILSSGGYTPSVLAQSSAPITVAPARQEITLEPGQTISVAVRFYNQSSSPVAGIVHVSDFIVNDASGTPTIIDSIDQATPKFSASQWFSLLSDRVVILGNSNVIIQAQVRVPLDAHPGGRYVAVYFQPGTPEVEKGKESASSGVTPRLAGLIYIKVPGTITEQALISRFFAKTFSEYGPVEVTTEITNRGDYHIQPKGLLSMTNMVGGLLAQEKLTDINIFPDASRTFKTSLGSHWMFGRYRIDLSAAYGDHAQALSRFIYVWILPWKIITAVLLTIILSSLLIRSGYRRLIVKESTMEKELDKERQEIEELKSRLKKKEE